MLTVISPAKRLDWSPVDLTPGEPDFLTEANRLVKIAREKSAADLSKLMGISAELGQLNADRFRDYRMRGDADVKPAAFAFAGDTYTGLEAATMDADALRWAEGHLRILSGLYGLLRPADGIQPYRLEMGTRLETPRGRDLYAFWGDRVAKALNTAAEEAGTDVLVNCASQEYFRVADRKALKLQVISPVFLDEKNGQAKVVSFFAKTARGSMARFLCEHQLTDPAALQEFDSGGYRFDADRSTPDQPVFLRSAAAAEALRRAS